MKVSKASLLRPLEGKDRKGEECTVQEQIMAWERNLMKMVEVRVANVLRVVVGPLLLWSGYKYSSLVDKDCKH